MPSKPPNTVSRLFNNLTVAGVYENRAEYPVPAVVLLDWNMPLMSGSEFLRWIRAHEQWRRLPVVVLTSSAWVRDMEQAYNLGANGFLVKPNRSNATSRWCNPSPNTGWNGIAMSTGNFPNPDIRLTP